MWHIQIHSPLAFQRVKYPQGNGASFGFERTRWFKNGPAKLFWIGLSLGLTRNHVIYKKKTCKSWFIVTAFRVISSPHIQQYYCQKGAESVVDIVNRFWAGKLRNRGSITGRGKSFLCSKDSTPSLVAHRSSLFGGYLPGAFSHGEVAASLTLRRLMS